jgi:hypothetical protein
MTIRLKALVLSASAVLAFLAIGTAAAQGANFKTEGEVYPVDIGVNQVGELVMKVQVEAGKNSEIKCKKSFFDGAAAAKEETLWVHPEYEECTAFNLPATVTTTGCDYRVKTNETFDVVCAGANTINVKTATCEFRIASQNGLNKVGLKNEVVLGSKVVIFSVAIGGISYTNVTDGIGCPLPDKLAHNNGTYSGEALAAAFNGGVQVNYTID